MQFVKNFLLKFGNKLILLPKLFRSRLTWLFKSDDSLMYTSIENLPTAKWWNINETQNYTLLLRNKMFITQDIYDKLEGVWDDIFDKHRDRFGESNEFKEYWRELNSLYKKKIKAGINGGSDESHYEFAQLRFDQKYKDKKTSNNWKLVRNIENILNMNYSINPETMPIIRFSSLVELAEETQRNGRN